MRVLAVLLSLSACAPAIEADLLEGPGYEAGKLAAEPEGTLWVGLTYLRVKNAPGPGKTFGDHAGAIGEHLLGPNPPEGVVGTAFRNEGRLRWWTWSVWESEEAMLAFVTDELHLAAMADFLDVTAAAKSTRFAVAADEVPATWDDALDVLSAEDWLVGEEEEPWTR